MNEFQAAMGLCNLRHVDREIEKRRLVTERYLENLEGLKGLKLPRYKEGLKPNYAYFPVIFDGFGADRDQVYEGLAAHHIYPRKYFYPLTNEFQCYQGHFLLQGYAGGPFYGGPGTDSAPLCGSGSGGCGPDLRPA